VGALLAAVVAAGLGGFARPAGADLCSDCPEPTTKQIEAASGKTLGTYAKHQVTAGSCTSEMAGKPVRRERAKVLVWSAHGEAYNCPTGKSTATVSYEVGNDKRFTWSFTATGGLELSGVVAKVSAEVSKQEGGSTGSSQTGRVEHEIEAAFCHRNEYWALFFASDVAVEFEFAVQRAWDWVVWLVTQPSLHVSGTVTTECGAGTVLATRLEPLFFSLGIRTRGCRDEKRCQGVATKWEGWFPPLPPGFDPFGGDGPPSDEPEPASPDDDESGATSPGGAQPTGPTTSEPAPGGGTPAPAPSTPTGPATGEAPPPAPPTEPEGESDEPAPNAPGSTAPPGAPS
jgi:hypothetical protein